MTDNTEQTEAKLTDAEKRKLVVEALELIGFEETMGFYIKVLSKTTKIVVNLTDGDKAVYFQINKSKVLADDNVGTLAKVGAVVINAEKGIMPHLEDWDTVPAEQAGTDTPMTDQPTESLPATELVRSTAPPPPPPPPRYQPKGSMILDITPALAEMGRIAIGGKGEERIGAGGKPYRLPIKYDHFKVVTKVRDANGDFIVDPVMEKWGFKDGKKPIIEGIDDVLQEGGPTELDIILLYDDPTLNFSTSYRQYKGGKCICTGNGQTAVNAAGETIKCHPNTCPIFKSKKCKPNGILSVVLQDSPGLGGVYKFRTTSFNSIRSILSSMFFIQTLTFGTLANIPLKMTLTPKTVNPIDSPTAQTIYVVNLIFPGTMEDLNKHTVKLISERKTMQKQIAALEDNARLALSEPESQEEIRDVEVEFYPDNEQEK